MKLLKIFHTDLRFRCINFLAFGIYYLLNVSSDNRVDDMHYYSMHLLLQTNFLFRPVPNVFELLSPAFDRNITLNNENCNSNALLE